MPWPEPRDDESENDFISRCMSNEYIQQDIPTQEQRLAVCYRQWEDRNKGGIEMEIERKSFIGIELKKDKPGAFIARIATLNVIDKDGDVTLPGAFPEGKTILISAYQHGSWMGELPVGKGIIHEHGNDVLVEGEFNLNTETGKEHYETVKFAPELQEWSYGFRVLEGEDDADFEGNHVSRILKKLDVFEASPVMRGAGMNTAVLAIKSESKGAIPYKDLGKAPEEDAWDAAKEVAAASVDDLKLMCAWVDSANKENKTAYKLPHHRAAGKHIAVWKGVAAAMAALLGSRGGVDIPSGDRKGVYNHLAKHYKDFEKEAPEFREDTEGMTYAEEAEATLAAVKEFLDRTKSLADLRRKEGRELSNINREKISALRKDIESIDLELKYLINPEEMVERGKEALVSLKKIYKEIQEIKK